MTVPLQKSSTKQVNIDQHKERCAKEIAYLSIFAYSIFNSAL